LPARSAGCRHRIGPLIRGQRRHHPARACSNAAALVRRGAIAVRVAVARARAAAGYLVSADGRHVGVRGQDGRLHLDAGRKRLKDAFLSEWLAADGRCANRR